MKKLLSLLIVINAIIIFLGFGLFYISETHPFIPGDSLFEVQNRAETWRLRLSPRGEEQTALALSLAERRLVHLAQIENPKDLDTAIMAFDDALDQAISYVQAADSSRELKMLLSKAQLVVYSLDKKIEGSELLETLKTKIENNIEVSPPVEPEDEVNIAASDQAPMVIDAEVISFLGHEVDHSMYPLAGKHETTDCLLCHSSGEYANTPTDCVSCHEDFSQSEKVEKTILISLASSKYLEPASIYLNHFEGACDECHNEVSWEPISFNHEGILECRSCHVEDTPVSEAGTQDLHTVYSNQCINCHEDVESWATITYLHEGVSECLSCHEAEEPEEHYTNTTCEVCHTEVEDWNVYEFDHTGYSDCATCHQPATEHYLGTCSTCHGNTKDWYDYDFYHMGMNDCQTCHVLEENHYSGQCSNCHTKDAWLPASFRHVGYSPYQCSTCHKGDAPSNHYSSACGHCHNTSSWGQINFNHSGYTNCQSCHSAPSGHYDGQCSNCHNTNSWGNYNFNHTGLTDCESCHSASTGHYDGQCSNCHNTNSWSDYHFNHTGLNDCQSCHTAPTEHYNGQCSDCHNTTSWSNINFQHTSSTNCSGCHQPPGNHYSGQCSNCHTSTVDWLKIKMDHSSGFSDCKSCHGGDRPPSPHPRNGQCSRCHTSDAWLPVKETSTPEPSDTPVPTTETPVPTTETPVPTTETPVPTTETPVPTTVTPVPTTETPTSTPTPTPPPSHDDGRDEQDCLACHTNW